MVSARHMYQAGMKVADTYAATIEPILYKRYMVTATQGDMSKHSNQEQLFTQNPHAVRAVP